MLSNMYSLVLASLASYIVACVIGASSLSQPIRNYIKIKTPFLMIQGHKHFIECRLCLSFWTSLFFSLVYFSSIYYTLPIYGISYFMATQER